MLIKNNFLLLSTICLCLLANNSYAQTETKLGNVGKLTDNTNICRLFSGDESAEIEGQNLDAPPPVRKLANEETIPVALTPSETEFYQNLGLIKNPDGSYTCMASDPNNPKRRFSIFKVKTIDGVVVISTFLDRGEFITGQQEAITDFFLSMISFYTSIPNQYYIGIKRYFQEFYTRIADGRIKPSRDRVYPVDEPEATVILYHPLQGSLDGTGLSLNIPLN